MRFLFRLSGEHETLPAAEVRALFEAVGRPLTMLHQEPGLLDGHAEVFADEAAFLSRLGMSHEACFHLFDGRPGAWPNEEVECCLPPGVSLGVRGDRVDPKSPWKGPEVEREVGALLAPGRKVRLKNPEMPVRAYLLRDRVAVGRQVWAAEPKELRARHVENRPYFSPVSLEPKLARVLINLSRAPPGGTLYDPFCGTGGILLEAAQMGLRAVGSDLDPEMVRGSEENLAHYGLQDRAVLFAADVADAPKRLTEQGITAVDAVVTDLPYGRSASTGREPRSELYARSFQVLQSILAPGRFAVVGVPTEPEARLGQDQLELVDLFRVREHRSLTRHFAVYRRN